MIAVTSGTLDPSKTHKQRSYHYVASPSAAFAGTLTTTLGRREVDSYSLSVVPGEHDTAEIGIVKTVGDADVYSCQVVAGKVTRCTCPGFGFTKKCKHRDAITAILADGSLTIG